MNVKTTGTVKFTLDPNHPPLLSKKARERLIERPDASIDFTDIPITHGVDWKRPGLLISAENKRQVTLRIDADVLGFFKTTGKKYQTRMNEVLRSYMDAQRQTGTSR